MAGEVDWKTKFERSEAARQKLRETLVLLREKALNTEQLLKQHVKIKEKLAEEQEGRKKAEAASTRLKKSHTEMQRRVSLLEAQMAEMQSHMTSVVQYLHQQHPEMASGSAAAPAPTATVPQPLRVPLPVPAFGVSAADVESLKAKVASHDKQLKLVTQVIDAYGGSGGAKSKKAKPGSTAAAEGRAAKAADVPQDPVRARAVAALRAHAGKPPPAVQEFLGGKQAMQQKEDEERPKKRVRMLEPFSEEQNLEEIGFSDQAIAALRAVIGGASVEEESMEIIDREGNAPQQEMTHDAAVKHAVKLFCGEGKAEPTAAREKALIAAFSCAVLECAAPAPQYRLAAPGFSPQTWWLSSAAEDNVNKKEQPKALVARKKGRKRTKEDPGGTESEDLSSSSSSSSSASDDSESDSDEAATATQSHRFPSSFLGVWCSTEMMERRSLPWLLHCAAQFATAAAQKTEAGRKKTRGRVSKAKIATSDTAFLEALAEDLKTMVAKDLPRERSLHTCTELCAAAAAASALWWCLGKPLVMQAFLIDILRSKPGHEASVLPVFAAAVEVWPEMVPKKGGGKGSSVGSSIDSLLQYACFVDAPKSALQRVDVRAAVIWLKRYGAEQWGWSSSADAIHEKALEKAAVAARRHLKKIAA